MSFWSSRRTFIPLLVVIVFLLYANSLTNGYIFDDVKVIQKNETIRSLRGVAVIFRDVFGYTPLDVEGNRIDPSYRPIRFVSYAIDYAITRAVYGDFDPSEPPPLIFHLTNVALHAACAILVFLIGLRLLPGSAFGPGIAALLFAAHPVQTEAVTYLSGRRDVLFAAFYLLALLAYLDHRETGRRSRAVICLASFVLSLFTKEMAVTLPLLLLVVKPPRRGEGGGWPPLIALFLIAAAFTAWKLLLKNPGAIGEEAVPYWGGGIRSVLITIPRVLFHYLGLIVFPLHLSADYSYDAFPASRSLLDPSSTAFALISMPVVFAAVGWAARRGERLLWLGAGWFGITLLPVLQLVPHPERVAERFLYLPIVGLALIAGDLIGRLGARIRVPILAPILAATLALLFGGRVILRNADWSDPGRLWGSVVECYPRCARARVALGAALMEEGKFAEAKPHFDACLAVIPLDGPADRRLRGLSLWALFNRAVCSYEMESHEEALRDCRRLLEEEDAFGRVLKGREEAALVYFNLGGILHRMGEEEGAIRHYRKALEFESNPDLADHMREAHVQLARIFYNRGEREKGIGELRRALALTPDHPRQMRIRFDMGEALRKMGRYADAEAIYEEALALDPSSKETRYRLAQVRLETDRKTAEVDLRRILEDHPDYLPALYSLADLEFRLGRYDEAERLAARVLLQAPDYAPARELLSAIPLARPKGPEVRKRDPDLLFRGGIRRFAERKYEEALLLFDDAIGVKEDHIEAHYLAGICHLHLGQRAEAIGELERTVGLEEGHAGARRALAELALEEKKVEEARRHLRTALDRAANDDPDTVPIRYLLSGILMEEGKGEEAIRLLEEARAIGPERADVLLRLVILRLDRKETTKARALLEILRREFPSSEEAAEALRRIEGK